MCHIVTKYNTLKIVRHVLDVGRYFGSGDEGRDMEDKGDTQDDKTRGGLT